MNSQEIKLRFGEMNASETRLAKAVCAWYERKIAAIKQEAEIGYLATASPVATGLFANIGKMCDELLQP